MPTYQYACTDDACGLRFEQYQAFTDDALTECPNCSHLVRKVYGSVGVVFKGSGFYRNDSREAASSTTPAAKGDSGSGDGASKSATKSESGSSDSGSSSTTKSSDSSSSSTSSSGSGSSGSGTSGSGSSGSGSSGAKSKSGAPVGS